MSYAICYLRLFERRIYRTRWFVLPFALILVLALHAPPLTLVALAGYALHNLVRRTLIAKASSLWLHWGGGGLLVLDIGAILLGVWPMATDGARAAQVVLAFLLLEAAQRLRFESLPISVAGIFLLTVTLCGYTLAVAQHGEEWRSAVVWATMLMSVAAFCLATYRKRLLSCTLTRRSEDATVAHSHESIQSVAHLPAEPEPSLSPRQREVVRLLASGMSTRDIAAELSISTETVRGHLKGVYRTFRTSDRDEVIRQARERGYVP